MKYAIELIPFGSYADPCNVVPLARVAEDSGWDGLFIWDHLAFAWGMPSGDPWITLSAVAQATQRLKLGTFVTPLPRRRPQVVAQQLVTLDLLSQGRVIFCAGLGGVPREYAAFGEPEDARTRGQMLDEGLYILNELMMGKPVIHQETHYRVDNVTLAPLPLQRPRIPIWIGGLSGAALRRAARWDGWACAGTDENCQLTTTPEEVAGKLAYIQQHRPNPGPFEVTMDGCTSPQDGPVVREFAAAGVTWWLEPIFGYRGSDAEMLARVAAGPPG